MKGTYGLKDYRPRIIDDRLERSLSLFGAVEIEGPRFCGKTETALRHSRSSLLLEDDENDDSAKMLAEISPDAAIEGKAPMLIDEWQEVPRLWDSVKTEVDRRAKNGQFILTSSFSPADLKTSHTGIGRIVPVRMRTMSLYETGDSSGTISLEKLCEGEMDARLTGEVTLNDLAGYVVRGGWPGASGGKHAQDVARDYVSMITDEFPGSVDGANYRKNKIRLLLESIARHEDTAAPMSKLISDIEEHACGGTDAPKICRESVSKYLDFLDRLYLLENTPPFIPDSHTHTRVRQEEMRHFCDVSLACAIHNDTPESLMRNIMRLSRLFESLCVHDLTIYAESFGACLCHYRDYRNREIDAVIELDDGRWCAFGITLGTSQIDSACERLKKTENGLEKEGMTPPSVMCVICGLSDAAYRRDDGIYVVPFTALRP